MEQMLLRSNADASDVKEKGAMERAKESETALRQSLGQCTPFTTVPPSLPHFLPSFRPHSPIDTLPRCFPFQPTTQAGPSHGSLPYSQTLSFDIE